MKKILIARLSSIGYALAGIRSLFKSEPNVWIHLMATIIVIAIGIFRSLNKIEWCFLIVAISLVWITEALNTAIEKLSNKVSPQFHPLIKQVKDISAGAVLLAALFAIIIGCMVFFF